MSGTLSAAVRFEDHFGPMVGEAAPPHEGSAHQPSPSRADAARLRELVEQMHRSVVMATMTSDHVSKVELWEAYRSARSEAIALASADPGGIPRLRSI